MGSPHDHVVNEEPYVFSALIVAGLLLLTRGFDVFSHHVA